jgi:DNA-binding CsgD family transcriptional regulator
MALLWGRYGEARRRLGVALELADSHEYRRLRRAVLVTLVQLDWLTGTWDGLDERAAALAGDEELLPMSRHEATMVTGLLAVAAGDRGRGRGLLEDVLAELLRRGVVECCQEPAAALARLALADEDIPAALAVTGEPAEIVARKGVWLWATDIAPVRAEALIADGRTSEAAALVTAFARGLRGRDAPAPKAGLALCRAVLTEARGEHARAAALYGRAAAAWQALPRPYDALLARERQARCLLAASQRENGLGLLGEALRGLSQLGAAGDAARAARTLRENGVQVRRPGAGRPAYGKRLSPRELEVVRLLVSGRSNRDVAGELYLSPKTVAGHVASAMRKLGAASPAALAAHAVEMGITAQRPAGVSTRQ